MFPYWLLFSLYAAGALNERDRAGSDDKLRPFFAVAGFVTAVLIGLRYEVGGDWFAYRQIFEDIGYQNLGVALTMSDPGYAFINWAVHVLGLGYWAVNLACGAIFVWGLYRFARQQPNPWLVLVVAIPYFVIVVSMGYTRQAVAIAFVLAALSAMQDRNFARVLLYIFLGVLFHKTAIIVLSLVGLAASRRKILTAGIALVSSIGLYYLFLASSFDTLVASYVEQAYASEGAMIRVLMNLPPALLFIFFSRRFAESELERNLWRNFSLAAFGALAMLFLIEEATTFVDRLALYLVPLQLFVLSRLPHAFSENGVPNAQLKIAVIGYSAAIQLVWLTTATHATFWVPYSLYPLLGDQ